jgi:hypothetical protein
MPKQRAVEARIAELEDNLQRLKTIKKIEELQASLPGRKKRRK